MKKLAPATSAQRVALDSATELLIHARAEAARAGAPRLLEKIRSALKSADGARRHLLWRRMNAAGSVAVLALALCAGGCASMPQPMPKPPLTMNTEDGVRWLILQQNIGKLSIGDRVCFYYGGAWVWGDIDEIRGQGVYRIRGFAHYVTPENYGGLMMRIRSVELGK